MVPRKLLNSDRLNSLGWAPNISLEEGLKKQLFPTKNLQQQIT